MAVNVPSGFVRDIAPAFEMFGDVTSVCFAEIVTHFRYLILSTLFGH